MHRLHDQAGFLMALNGQSRVSRQAKHVNHLADEIESARQRLFELGRQIEDVEDRYTKACQSFQAAEELVKVLNLEVYPKVWRRRERT